MTDESDSLLRSYDAKNLSVEDFISKGTVKLKKKSDYSIAIYYNETGLNRNINEIARADFNGDGVEDILLAVANYAILGSYRTYHVCTATRFKKDKMLRHFNCQ